MDALTGQRMGAKPLSDTPELGPRADPPKPGDGGEALVRFVNCLRRNQALILGLMTLGAVLAAFAAFFGQPTYTATAQLMLDLHRPGLSAFRPAAPTPVPMTIEESAIETHITLLQSNATLRRAIATLPGAGESGEPTIAEARSVIGLARAGLRNAWSALAPMFGPAPAETGGDSANVAETPTLSAIRRNIKIGQERRSRIIAVSFVGPNAQQAAEIANAIANVYVDSLRERRRRDAADGFSWATRRLAEVQQQIGETEAAMHAYRLAHPANDGPGPDEIEQEITQILRQLTMASSTAQEAEGRLQEVRALRQRGASAEEIANALGSARLTALAKLAREAADRPQQSDTRRAALRDALEAEIASDTAALETVASTSKAQLRAMQERLSILRQTAGATAAGSSELREMARRLASLNGLYDSLARQRQDFAEQSQIAEPELTVLMAAETPTRTSSINGIFLIPPAVIAFGLIGAMLSLVRDRMDTALRGERDVADALRVPCIALMPERSRAFGSIQALLRDNPHSAYARGLRTLFATSLPFCGDRAPRVIAVTSSVPEEGKTTLAWSLALAAAALDWRVALLDFGNGPAPPRKMLDADETADPDAAVFDMPACRAPAEEATRSISAAGIHYVPVRRDDHQWLSLLFAPQLSQFLEQLRDSHDLIVIDSPAVLERPEIAALAAKADKIFFCVRWGRTQGATARNALALLDAADCPERDVTGRISAVVTRVNVTQHLRYRLADRGDVLANWPR